LKFAIRISDVFPEENRDAFFVYHSCASLRYVWTFRSCSAINVVPP
jgi:hypothetical protein